MKLSSMNTGLYYQSGATMIEILIAILVFSVGLLGVATTQTMGITSTQSSLNKSYAVQYAYELVDIMRANESIAKSSSNNLFQGFATISNDGKRSEPEDNISADSDCHDSSIGCSALEMAADELANWENKVQSLPDGQASISLSNNVYTVLITWADVKSTIEAAGKASDESYLNVAGENISTANGNGLAFYRFSLDFSL